MWHANDRVALSYRGILDISNRREQPGYSPASANIRYVIADDSADDGTYVGVGGLR